MATARDQLLALATDKNAWPYPEQIARLLDAYRAEVREEVAQEIDAAGLRNRSEYPGIDAMVVRRLGLAQAARIARDGAGEGR